jgi:carboxylate-amine ligase
MEQQLFELQPYAWNPSRPLTLGVEVEAQLVDWRTQDLCPAAIRVLGQCDSALIKAEIFQSMVELCTHVCDSLSDVERELGSAHRQLLKACDALGIEVLGTGTHPFGLTQQRLVSNSSRYRMLMDRNQWIARRMTIFGLHVHVGVPQADQAIHLMNAMLPYLSTLLALSASSPYWCGQDTGLASARSTVFESQPTAGCPPTLRDWADFEQLCQRLTRSQSITCLKDLWWDIRPNPTFGTLEIRICDGCPSLPDTLGLVALIQCLAASLLEPIQAGEIPQPPALWRLRENKWRAARWGMEASLLVDDEGTLVPVRSQVTALLEQLSPVATRLNCEQYLYPLEHRVDGGSSAYWQRRVFEHTGSLRSLVQELVAQWRTGL